MLRVIGTFAAENGKGFCDVEVDGIWYTLYPSGKAMPQCEVTLYWEMTAWGDCRWLIFNTVRFV